MHKALSGSYVIYFLAHQRLWSKVGRFFSRAEVTWQDQPIALLREDLGILFEIPT